MSTSSEAGPGVARRRGGGARRLVIKFGGTSLGSPARIRRAAARVRAHVERGFAVVVVVSATGRTTDRILAWLRAVDPAGPEPREADRALATGETLSAALFTAALAAEGVQGRSLSGGEAGLLAAGPFGDARIAGVVPARLLALLAEEVVPVVAGFQARSEDGETRTLGRGGSDTSAVAIAGALGAACHIVTDVDGVYDRDPRLHGGAIPFRSLTHDALVGLTRAGASVVHPDAAALARDGRIPLRIHHYRAPLSGGGTRVLPDPASPRAGRAAEREAACPAPGGGDQ